MAGKMLQFVSWGAPCRDKREASARRGRLRGDLRRVQAGGAAAQSSRCSQCGVPFCQVHCPLHNNIPDWLKLTAEGRLEEAYELSAATNNLPEICGRICPQDRLCEGNCVIEQSGHGTVTIGAVEKYITDTAWESGWVKPVEAARASCAQVGRHHRRRPGRPRRRRAAAPAAATRSRLRPLRPRRRPADLRHPQLQAGEGRRRAPRQAARGDGGIDFHLNFDIGKRRRPSPSCAQRHDAVLIATGVYKARDTQGAGRRRSAASCRRSISSPPANRQGLGDAVPEFDDRRAQRRRQAASSSSAAATPRWTACAPRVRQGATSVTCLYRRDRANMPGSQREVHTPRKRASSSSGSPRRKPFVRQEARRRGGARACACVSARPTPPAARRREDRRAAHFDVEADLVIKALGFDPEDLPALFGEPELEVTRWGTVKVDPPHA